jgi:hypothetical protein
LHDPTLPLSRFPRLCGFSTASFAGHVSVSSRALSSSFAFLQSITQLHLAGGPRPASSSHGLSFPSAHEESKVHLPRALPARYVPPSGFGYPLDGLLPSIPCRFCFAPAALVGFALRSLTAARGSRTLPCDSTRRPFRLGVNLPPERKAGPTGRGSWALTLSGVPDVRTWV